MQRAGMGVGSAVDFRRDLDAGIHQTSKIAFGILVEDQPDAPAVKWVTLLASFRS